MTKSEGRHGTSESSRRRAALEDWTGWRGRVEKGKESKKAEGDEGVEEERRMEIMGLRRRDWGQE